MWWFPHTRHTSLLSSWAWSSRSSDLYTVMVVYSPKAMQLYSENIPLKSKAILLMPMYPVGFEVFICPFVKQMYVCYPSIQTATQYDSTSVSILESLQIQYHIYWWSLCCFFEISMSGTKIWLYQSLFDRMVWYAPILVVGREFCSSSQQIRSCAPIVRWENHG